MGRVVAFLQCAAARRMACKFRCCASISAAGLRWQVVVDDGLQDDMMPVVDHDLRSSTRRRKKDTPMLTTAVRRSPRNHIHAGYKVNMPSDTRKRKSKVKSCVNPTIGTSSPAKESEKAASPPSEPASSSAASPPVPPPTSVSVLQKIEVNICGIPPEELKEDKLQDARPQDEA